jgi:hypothetical protein
MSRRPLTEWRITVPAFLFLEKPKLTPDRRASPSQPDERPPQMNKMLE